MIFLLFDGRGKAKGDKKMYGPDGTGRYVSYNQWKTEVVFNPKGTTAMRAKKENDPDLKEIVIPVIGINHGSNPETVKMAKDPGNFVVPSRGGPTVASTISPEKAKQMGFRKAENGKGGR